MPLSPLLILVTATDTGFCNIFTGGEEQVVFAKFSNNFEEIGFFFSILYWQLLFTNTIGMGRGNEEGVESPWELPQQTKSACVKTFRFVFLWKCLSIFRGFLGF